MSYDDLPSWIRKRLRGFPFFGPYSREMDLDEYTREFDRMIQEMFKEFEKFIPSDLMKERKLADGSIVREAGPFVYGYSVTIGPDGKPHIREFGNVKPSLRGPRPLEVSPSREPLVDVVDEGDRVRVTAEVPGVEKENIKLELAENQLTISVETPDRKYYKEIELPAAVKTEEVKAAYKNGILEVSLPKARPAKPKGKQVTIE